MLGNTELFCQNGTVTLRLRKQNHKIRVVQNVLDFTACQKVFDVLRQSRRHTSFFTQHFPDCHKVAGCQRITEQDMKLVKVAPSRRTLVEVLIHRLRNKLICDVHCNLSKVFAHVFQNDAHHTAVRLDVGRMVKEIEGACAIKL